MVSSSLNMRLCPQCGTQCVDEHKYCPACGFPIGTVQNSVEDKLIGQTLPGGYLILDLLSVGGMGRVYRAEQRVLGRTVAVKIIHPHLLSDESSGIRFMTEARAASQLNHPNSVSVIDFGRTDDGQPYLVMEFLQGKDLARVSYDEGLLKFSRIVEVLRQVLAALAEAHDLGIVHRDLKPENIILRPLRRGGDHVKVVDFGLAKLKADAKAPSVTSPGIVCGTPDYMAPEQGRGDPIDGRSDLYSVGVILFQLLTGKLPFDAENPTQVVMMHLSIPVPDPRQMAPQREIPTPLVDVVSKALQKDPADRYQDAFEFADALKTALDYVQAETGERVHTSPPPPVQVVQCSTCQSEVPIAKFCGECGARLSLRPPAAPPPPPTLPLELLGREEDLAWLEDRRQQTTESMAGARLVGEPGVGKTRLLNEFLSRCQADGDQVVLTGPDPYWAEVAYYTLRRAITGLLQVELGSSPADHWSEADPAARRGLEEVFGKAPSEEIEPSSTALRMALAEALRWALSKALHTAGSRRVILAIDDLHRVDGPSRSAIADALGEATQSGILLLATHIPGFETGWSSDHAARVMSGLPAPLVSKLLNPGDPDHHLRAMSDGGGRGILPMYVVEHIRFIEEGGSDPSPRLADLIAQRVENLDPDARRLLQALAVLGDEVERSAFQKLLPGLEGIAQALEQLTQAGMVEVTEERISTSHPLLRDIVLAAIPAGVRRDLHSRAVHVCEESEGPIETRALHAFYSQDSFQALLLLEQVAGRASARGDVAAAILALRRGLELARQEISRGELDDPMRAVLIFSRKLGDALTQAGSYSDAEGVLQEALDLAGPSGTDRARVLWALAHVARGRKRSEEAFSYIDQAIEVAQQSGARDLLSSLRDARRAWAS